MSVHFATPEGIACGVRARFESPFICDVDCQRCIRTSIFTKCQNAAAREDFDRENEAYERAAARYDGNGRDWR